MTCHANQQPLLYNRLRFVIDRHTECMWCHQLLPKCTPNVIGNEHGYFCNEDHFEAFMDRHEKDEIGQGIVWALAAVAFVALLLLVVRGI